MKPLLISKVSFGLAALDALMAFLCAANGDATCVWFTVLGGLMLAHGLYFLSKAEKEGE